MLPLIVLGVAAAIVLFLILFGGMLVNIGGTQVGILERRYFGKGLPEGRVVALAGEVGIQARVFSPFHHRVRKVKTRRR